MHRVFWVSSWLSDKFRRHHKQETSPKRPMFIEKSEKRQALPKWHGNKRWKERNLKWHEQTDGKHNSLSEVWEQARHAGSRQKSYLPLRLPVLIEPYRRTDTRRAGSHKWERKGKNGDVHWYLLQSVLMSQRLFFMVTKQNDWAPFDGTEIMLNRGKLFQELRNFFCKDYGV